MAAQILRHGLRMRESFDVLHHDVAHWFPGHMAKGVNQMQRKLKTVDCIIEVHDARIPLSGRNPLFERTLSAIKPHVLVLNKMDLADLKHRNNVVKHYNTSGVKHVVYTNCKKPDSAGVKSLVPFVTDIIRGSERYNRAEETAYQLMVIGVPNVGKSSLINALRARHLRRSKATQEGGVPGVTQSVLTKIKVCEDPRMFLLDTPGVMAPRIPDVETGLKLALCATIKDHLVGQDTICDYLLYRLNASGNHSYVAYMSLDEPTDDITQLLNVSAIRNNWQRRVRTHHGPLVLPDITQSQSRFLKGFRTGAFGKAMLDDLRSP